MSTPLPAQPLDGAFVAPVPRAAPRRRVIAAITIGNGLEFYDFTVYSFFAVLIGKLFFPVSGGIGQLMLSLATFGVGFVARPLGGLLIGLYADRVGRKPAMALTLWLMGLGSLLFVVAPTYAQAGMAAPLLIVLARLLQGFALGGEVGASTALLMEYADDHSRGYYGSWQLFSQGVSVLLGAVVGLSLTNGLSPDALQSWGWRVPFAIGILVIPLGLYIRRHLEETAGAPAAGAPGHEGAGLAGIFGAHGRVVVAGVLVTIGGTSATYIVLHYMTSYAATVLKIPLGLSMAAGCVAALVQVALSAQAGRLSDRIGRKPAILWSRVAMLALIYPAFMLLNARPSLGMLLAVVAVLALLLVLNTVPSVVLITELFPRRIRASGLSVVYCIGVLIFGGFAQLIATWLIELTGNASAPALYVIGCGLISLVGLAMVPETAGKRLD
ncbi:MFS transporter [Cupriavidus taiwanensis]|uniref:General substrate transporter, MFS family n=1 Tax=Cupriavidus taiwanensis (strain DSM 17343 / BCRC 17206 / CCUG 44338 / CIP 107171 / LMG 19424 / R1) TaxID=977880 RepID=B3RBX9_CUPTR|nr:MFS transporter [Cupriavidus taiwanensis]CAQ72404.1 putative general substrate transporter, MFS family [Cupriavidus taiwanensis LMG 19424]